MILFKPLFDQIGIVNICAVRNPQKSGIIKSKEPERKEKKMARYSKELIVKPEIHADPRWNERVSKLQ